MPGTPVQALANEMREVYKKHNLGFQVTIEAIILTSGHLLGTEAIAVTQLHEMQEEFNKLVRNVAEKSFEAKRKKIADLDAGENNGQKSPEQTPKGD